MGGTHIKTRADTLVAFAQSQIKGDVLRGQWFYMRPEGARDLVWFHCVRAAVARAAVTRGVSWVDLGPSSKFARPSHAAGSQGGKLAHAGGRTRARRGLALLTKAGGVVGTITPDIDQVSGDSLSPYSEAFGIQRFRECT